MKFKTEQTSKLKSAKETLDGFLGKEVNISQYFNQKWDETQRQVGIGINIRIGYYCVSQARSGVKTRN